MSPGIDGSGHTAHWVTSVHRVVRRFGMRRCPKWTWRDLGGCSWPGARDRPLRTSQGQLRSFFLFCSQEERVKGEAWWRPRAGRKGLELPGSFQQGVVRPLGAHVAPSETGDRARFPGGTEALTAPRVWSSAGLLTTPTVCGLPLRWPLTPKCQFPKGFCCRWLGSTV